jgi:co-chaperonin GroES (HSP10)
MHQPNPSGQHSLIPINGSVLVKLEKVDIREGKYETRTNGIAVASDHISMTYKGIATTSIVGKRVFFDEYKEGARIKRDGDQYCFIKFEDIRGFEDVKIN